MHMCLCVLLSGCVCVEDYVRLCVFVCVYFMCMFVFPSVYVCALEYVCMHTLMYVRVHV